MRLPIQPSLTHRGDVKASLFPPPEIAEKLGGSVAINRIIDGLYDRIEKDKVLRPAFGHHLAQEREKLKQFFQAWLGGPPSYFNHVWPPSLGAAHAGIIISRGMAERWVGHFLESCANVVDQPETAAQLKPFISRLAMVFVNQLDEPIAGEKLRCSTTGADLKFMRSIQRDEPEGIVANANEQPRLFRRQRSRLLVVAAVRGKGRAAEELLRQGVNVNQPALLPGGEATAQRLPILPITPLCAALAKDRDSVVKLLVEHGAQYDIFTAAFVGDLEAVKELLDVAPELANAPDPASDVGQITPLLHAVYAGQLEVARLLLQRGAAVGPNSVRLVRAAANQGNEALTQLLLDQGASAVEIGPGTWAMYPVIADGLLARGADVNQPAGTWIGLCCTGNSGHRENSAFARALLRCGADVAAYYKGRTALHCVAKAGFMQVAEALIEYGADVNALNDRGQTPLDEVETAGRSINREPVRQLLVTSGARRSKFT